MGTNNPCGFLDHNNPEELNHVQYKKMPCFITCKISLTNQIHMGNIKRKACVVTHSGWENLSINEYLHIFSSQIVPITTS